MAEYFQADWYLVLREACSRSSQNQVAKRLNVNAAVVSKVLRGRYEGAVDGVEARVRGELMRATLTCPVLGDISTRRCQDEQRRPFAATNHLRVALFHACRSRCVHGGPAAAAPADRRM